MLHVRYWVNYSVVHEWNEPIPEPNDSLLSFPQSRYIEDSLESIHKALFLTYLYKSLYGEIWGCITRLELNKESEYKV